VKDLYRCLSDFPMPLRRAVSEAWQTDLTPGPELEDVRALADAILSSPRVSEVLGALSARAREALDAIVCAGGALPAARLRDYGSLPRSGAARLARERPWRSPASPLEELYYKGLVYRAYGSPEEALAEIVLVPEDLQTVVAGHLSVDAAASLGTVDAVPSERLADDACSEDLLAILVRLRSGGINAIDPQPDPAAPDYAPDALDLGQRLQGPREPERLALLRQLLWRLRLVRTVGGRPQPSLRARDWLRLSQTRRQRAVYLAWRDDPHWSELYHLAGLRFGEEERTVHSITQARRNLVTALERTPPDRWIPLADMVAYLKRVRPDFLRADGDYDSAYARSASSGEYLTGFAHWEAVEGTLARHLLARSLHWLGLVDLGLDPDGTVTACRVSAAGRRILTEQSAGDEDGAASSPASVAMADDALIVTVPVSGTLYDRYRLERIGEWLSQDETARYRMAPDTIWSQQDGDISVEQVTRFLKRITGGALDAAALNILQAWGERYGRVAMRRVVLLDTADEATMRRLLSSPRVRALLGPAVSSRSRLVEEEHLGALHEALDELGITPRMRRARPASRSGAAR